MEGRPEDRRQRPSEAADDCDDCLPHRRQLVEDKDEAPVVYILLGMLDHLLRANPGPPACGPRALRAAAGG